MKKAALTRLLSLSVLHLGHVYYYTFNAANRAQEASTDSYVSGNTSVSKKLCFDSITVITVGTTTLHRNVEES